MTFIFDEREASRLTELQIEQIKQLDNPYDDSGMGAYVSIGGTHMLLMIRADNIVGKAEYCRTGPVLMLEWLCAPGNGDEILGKLEKFAVEDGATSIILTCGLDPREEKSTVMRRLNFYAKHGYRTTAIEYMANVDGATRLKMRKKLKRIVA